MITASIRTIASYVAGLLLLAGASAAVVLWVTKR